MLSDSLGLWTCIAFFQERHVSIKQMLFPLSPIPQISLLFIVIVVPGGGDSLWVIRLTGTCARLVCKLLFAITVKVLLQSNIKPFEEKIPFKNINKMLTMLM